MSSSGPPLCCYGAGGHGKVVASQWAARHGGEVVFGDSRLETGSAIAGFTIRYGSPSDIADHQVLITVGDNAMRRELQRKAEQSGTPIARFVADPDNYFTDAPGAGAMILAGAIVNAGAVIGEGVIINTNATIEHDCKIGDFTHISPGAVVAGGCRIGEDCWIGAGAVILPSVAIAAGSVIGAGSVVTGNIGRAGTYVGVPAKRLKPAG